GCNVNKPLGVEFAPAGGGGRDGSSAVMDVPVASTGPWSATFFVPSYLGHPNGGGKGELVSPGSYQLTAPMCTGGGSARATFQVTGALLTVKTEKRYVGIVATLDGGGYWLVQADGVVSRFGDAGWFGSLPSSQALKSPVVGMARTYDEEGYWLADAAGHVYPFGDARNYGSLGAAPGAPVTGISATPDGRGYWLVTASGRVYPFGDAKKVTGSPTDQLAPFDAIGTRLGGGYVVTTATDAAVYEFPGDTLAAGGPGNATSGSFVGTAVTPSGNGTFQAEANGQVLATGDATYYGSPVANLQIVSAPLTAIASTPSGQGYWLLGADGNVYNFGNAAFYGSGLR
ncbi:MAG TPA: hypothetical protein VL984_01810, partial [Acidimicrobiales bacterium]|nr:hypothetical protein [Acidimicrobiales bacterium]